jgi:hypothetical protein
MGLPLVAALVLPIGRRRIRSEPCRIPPQELLDCPLASEVASQVPGDRELAVEIVEKGIALNVRDLESVSDDRPARVLVLVLEEDCDPVTVDR